MGENEFIGVVHLSKRAGGINILYDMCDERKFPWGDTNRLAEKMLMIGRIHNASPEIRLKNFNDITFFKELAEFIVNQERYGSIIDNLKSAQEYAYDKSLSDMQSLKSVFFSIADFNEIVQSGVNAVDEAHSGPRAEKVSHLNPIKFSSNFLHYHFPHKVCKFHYFPNNAAKILFSEDRCCLGSVSVDADTQRALIAEYKDVLSIMLDMDFFGTKKICATVCIYFHYFVKSYALCRFLKEKCELSELDGIRFMQATDCIFNEIRAE